MPIYGYGSPTGARLRSWTHTLLDLIFPPRCAGCGAIGHSFCPSCAQAVAPTPGPLCPRCGRPQERTGELCRLCRQEPEPALSLVRAAALHTYPLRPAIHAFKYENRPELARPLARYLIALAMHPPLSQLLGSVDGVVPVPLHASRLADRGYNQSALLARSFAEHWGLAVREDWLARARETRTQVGLTAAERRKNVADAFVASQDVAGRLVMLVDDVFTTGSTLNACAVALAQAGAAEVVALALATPRPQGRSDGPPDVATFRDA